MKVQEIKSKKLYKEYSLEVPFKEVDEKIDEKIKELIPTTSIPGFRKGKAPINIVRKKYENNILNEVIQKLLVSKTNELINKKKFKLFRQPKVDLKNFEKNKPVEISIKIDLQPEVELKDFNKINLNKYEINLSEKIVNKQFKEFLASQKSFKKIDEKRPFKKN